MGGASLAVGFACEDDSDGVPVPLSGLRGHRSRTASRPGPPRDVPQGLLPNPGSIARRCCHHSTRGARPGHSRPVGERARGVPVPPAMTAVFGASAGAARCRPGRGRRRRSAAGRGASWARPLPAWQPVTRCSASTTFHRSRRSGLSPFAWSPRETDGLKDVRSEIREGGKGEERGRRAGVQCSRESAPADGVWRGALVNPAARRRNRRN